MTGPGRDRGEGQVHGACTSADTEMCFHPDGERGPSRSGRETAAKAVCATCPVLARCRTHALEAREPYGVWGGLSEADREQILGGALRRTG